MLASTWSRPQNWLDLTPNTIRNWLKRGEAHEQPFDAFLRAFKRARANAEARITKNVLKASELPQYWAAGATYLERTYPDRWGRRQEDSSSPRIVVQIGARDSDVSVQVNAQYRYKRSQRGTIITLIRRKSKANQRNDSTNL